MTVTNENNTIDSILNNSNNLLCSTYKNKYEQIQCPNKRKHNLMFCGKHRNMIDIIFNNEIIHNEINNTAQVIIYFLNVLAFIFCKTATNNKLREQFKRC